LKCDKDIFNIIKSSMPFLLVHIKDTVSAAF